MATVLANTLRWTNFEISVHFFDWGVFSTQTLRNGCGVVWFRLDGTTDHTARTSMNLLQEHFRPVSLRDNLQWPARSPDLAPCDYFLWGYLKSWVYTNRPWSAEGQYSCCYCRHRHRHAGKSGQTFQNSSISVYWRRRWPPSRCRF